MKLTLSITDNIFFSFLFICLIIHISSCTKKTVKEETTQEETLLKAFEEEKIKPVFIEEAAFYKSANKSRQVTELPKDPLPPIDREKFVDFPETYDPFSIIFIDDNSGVSTRNKIWYTFDYDKDNADWKSLSFDEATYIHHSQTRWDGKIPKWFKASIETIGVTGSETIVYINTLKQKKDVYMIVQGSYLGDEYTSSAEVIIEDCVEPKAIKEARLKKEKKDEEEAEKDKNNEDIQKVKEEEEEKEGSTKRENEVITEASKYKVDNEKYNQCLKWYYNKRDYSHAKNGFQENAKPTDKTLDPIKNESRSAEDEADDEDYNI